MNIAHSEHARFDTLLGTAEGGVGVYSSHYPSADNKQYADRRAFRSYIDDLFMGYKWQCVELARRWLYVNKGYVFEDVAMAYDIFDLRHVKRVADGALLPLQSFLNGSKRHPEPGCMLIWNEGGDFHTTGHVAIVTEVLANAIRFIEQNVEDKIWPAGANYSRELPTVIDGDGCYWVVTDGVHDKHGESVLGWVLQTDNDKHAYVPPETNPQLFCMRDAVSPKQPPADWITEDDPLQKAYIKSAGGAWLTQKTEDSKRYFWLSETAEKELRRATNELHSMFLMATDVVLQDERLLEKFNIPSVIWEKVQTSWNNRRNQMITGRIDFSLSEHGLKMYEYNADSASCYYECGVLQGAWATAAGVEKGWDPGGELFQHLVDAWQRSGVDDVLHIMRDNDPEETYHALYMKSAAEKAGIPCKIIPGFKGLSWDDEGYVVDQEGQRILWVWKTWAWETALEQLRRECDEEKTQSLVNNFNTVPNWEPRLIDVLLRENVMVYEPLWTIIPSNKAILPVLSELFPDHPYLLKSEYTLTADMASRTHVIKPIAGRCGLNISIVDSEQEVIKETSGQFDYQDQIYQEYFPLPKFGKENIQVCTFSVDGVYSGACLRADKSLVITTHSDILPLRSMEDDVFLSMENK